MQEISDKPYLLIAGDVVPTMKNENIFIEGDMSRIFDKEIKKVWDNATYRIFNLETPISDNKTYLEKAGTFLGASSKTFNGVKKLVPDLVCLANNHILDLDEIGARDTLKFLEQANINYIGIGENINRMNSYCFYEYENKKVCIYNCCEHEFTYATSETFGTNPFNPLKTLFELQRLKKKCDYLIVIYHGGKELYQYCTPKLQEICYAICEAGSDLVVCQHSHCIGCFEKYKNSTIIYGQGNFIFDLEEEGLWDKLTKEGMLIKLNLNDFTIDFIKFKKENDKIILVSPTDLEDFYERSNHILEENFVKKNYIERIEDTSFHYFRQLLSTKYIGFVDKKIFGSYFMKRRYKKLRLLLINYFDCEVHLENILVYLKEIKELKNS